jgi:hypothetical protein
MGHKYKYGKFNAEKILPVNNDLKYANEQLIKLNVFVITYKNYLSDALIEINAAGSVTTLFKNTLDSTVESFFDNMATEVSKNKCRGTIITSKKLHFDDVIITTSTLTIQSGNISYIFIKSTNFSATFSTVLLQIADEITKIKSLEASTILPSVLSLITAHKVFLIAQYAILVLAGIVSEGFKVTYDTTTDTFFINTTNEMTVLNKTKCDTYYPVEETIFKQLNRGYIYSYKMQDGSLVNNMKNYNFDDIIITKDTLTILIGAISYIFINSTTLSSDIATARIEISSELDKIKVVEASLGMLRMIIDYHIENLYKDVKYWRLFDKNAIK